MYLNYKKKKVFGAGRKPLEPEVTLTSPDGEVHDCILWREKHYGKLFMGYFDIRTKKLVATVARTISERWKTEFR